MAGKKTGKRLLTWVLVLVMALSLLPLNALAEDIPPEYRPTIEWTNDYLAGYHSLTVEVVHEGHSLGTISSTDKHFSATVKLSNDSIEVYDSEATGGSYSRNTLKLFTFGLGSTEGYLKLYTRSTAGHKVTVNYVFNDDSGRTKTVEKQVKYQDEETFELDKKHYSCTFNVTSGNAEAKKDALGRLAVTGGTEPSVVTVTYTPEDNFIFIDKYYDNGGIFSKWNGENIRLNGYKFVENNKLAEKSVIANSDLTPAMEAYRFLTVTNKDGSDTVYDFSYAVMIPKTSDKTITNLTGVWYDRDAGDWYCSSLLFKNLVVGNKGGVNFCYNTVHSENSTHHLFELVETVAPTCTEGGYSLYKCAYCAKTEQRDQTAAPNHDWGSWTHDAATTGAESAHTRICKRDASHTETESCNFIEDDGTYTCSKCGYSYGTHTAPTYPVYVYAFFAHNGKQLTDNVTVNGKPIEWNEDANNEEYKEYFVTLGVYPNGTTQKPTDGAMGLLDLAALKGKEYETATGDGSGTKNGVALNNTSFPSPSGKVCKGAAGYPEIGDKLSWHLDGQVNVYTVTYDYNGGTAQGTPTSNGYYFGSYTIAAAPKRDGYTFTGWKDGNTTYPADKEITLEKDLKLVAQWTAKEPDTVTINLSDYIKKDLKVIGSGFQGETFTVTVTGDSESGGGQFTGSVTYAANEGNASLKAFTDWKVVHSPTGDNYVFNDNGTITFKEVTTGTAYSFTVDEAKGGTEEMDYDGSSRSFNVWVGTDKESGKLKITKTSKPITLENHYNGTFPVALGQYIKKVYKSECSCAPETTFRFEALIEERVPEANALSLIESVPVEKESKVYTAKGSVTLKAGTEQTADMSIQLPEGFYEVTLKEVNDKTANVKYDKTVYTFGISVLEDGGNVKIGFFDVKKDGKEYNEQGFVFTNSYVHSHFIPVSPKHSKPTLNTGDHYAYVMGYPDGTVRPNGSITRAEVSTILFRLLSDKTRDEYFTTESSFTDVKAGAWYNNSIATLEKAGVIVDTAKGGAFRPNEAITRAELAAMLAQFSDAKPVKGVKFSDVSAGHWAYEAIAIAAKMGWIEGYPDGTFRPDATITRAEMMTLVNRALERVPSDEDHLLSKRVMLTFPDCKSGDWFYIAVQEATNSHTYERAATEKNGDEQWTALRANRDWTLLEK